MIVLIGVIAAMLLFALDQTVVATAMPQIVRELNGLSHLSWVFTAYMLALVSLVLVFRFKVNSVWLMLGGAVLGLAYKLVTG